ncbi:hypothetical protein syc2228_d [Synechococcus elongatus PCC 6301]|uniref:DUF1824 domain-containing protein n=1 Tax=Synechococcus sp. (strain ATCC 27144 / PCC 6301 / SAUG 1402/1) TaxID=269084 RepID=A0A0H3K5F2_SYNP6|nr:hypothetical protein syc2228_d [Synechococcus elongatus PCC 6301]
MARVSEDWTLAEQRLQQYRCQTEDLQLSPEAVQQLRSDLHTLVTAADFLTLGICAETSAIAQAALAEYWAALQQPALEPTDLPAIAEPCFLKANGRSGRLLLDTYEGAYRGVLITVHSDLAAGPSGTYGHFPLDLFAAA